MAVIVFKSLPNIVSSIVILVVMKVIPPKANDNERTSSTVFFEASVACSG